MVHFVKSNMEKNMHKFKRREPAQLAATDRVTKEHGSRESDSKQAVLDAAQKLISQYGYAGFSMRDLAQHSGLAKATLYHHFEDKREIFLQVLKRDLIYVRDHLAAAAASPGDLATRLGTVASVFFAVANERGVLLLSTLRQAADMDNEFYELMRDYRHELHRPIVEMLDAGMADGSIRSVDADLAAMSFFGILQVFATRRLLINDMQLDDQAVDFIIDFVLKGLATSPTTATDGFA
jgi:AcrR family transcriptional regulator